MTARPRLLHVSAAVLALLASGCGAGGGAPAPLPRLLALDGREVEAIPEAADRASVFLFTRTDCPISNRYAPEVRRIHDRFAERGVAFRLVFVDPGQSPEAIRRHVAEFGYPMEALRDPDHALVARTGVRVTPEAAVFAPRDGGQELVYRGRIDDWYVDFGKSRRAPSTHDLEAALDAILAGEPVPRPRTQAVGCYIADLS